MANVIVGTPRSFASWNALAANSPDFCLDEGVYGLLVDVTGATVTLQKLLPDGVTYVAVSAAISADSYTVLQLPAGQYRLLVAGGTVSGEIALIARGSG